MKTEKSTRKDIEKAVECLKNGGVVAFPTDTVYGLGVVYDNVDALNRLKLSKGRPDNKPIPMMISSLSQLEKVAMVNSKIKNLAKQFMPGGFTIILNKKEIIPDEITNGYKTIAIRMPNDEFILEMMEKLQKPLLVTSANLSGQPTGVYYEDVKRDFDGRIDMIVQGECKGSVSSTIVDATEDEIKIIRSGPIDENEIRKVWAKS